MGGIDGRGSGAVAERRDSRVGNCHWLDSKSGCLQQSSPFGSPPFSQQLHLDVIDTFSNDASSACPTGDWPVCQPLPLQHEMGKGRSIQNDIEAEIPICFCSWLSQYPTRIFLPNTADVYNILKSSF